MRLVRVTIRKSRRRLLRLGGWQCAVGRDDDPKACQNAQVVKTGGMWRPMVSPGAQSERPWRTWTSRAKWRRD